MKRISLYAHSFRLEDAPANVVKQAKRIILDTLGVILGGYAKEQSSQGLLQQQCSPLTQQGATVVGKQGRYDPVIAAVINGTASVSIELDEGNAHAKGHPGSHVLPAILAVAESRQLSGRRVLEAFIVAYEIATRAGKAAHLHEFVHPHGTHSVIGAALGVGMVLGLSASQLEQAMYLASNFAVPSSQNAALVGATVRNMFTGVANASGIWAAYGAKSGITGEADSANLVFANMLGTKFDADMLEYQLGSRYLILENYFKLHACSRWNHAPIDAAERLRDTLIHRVKEIDRIDVYTYDPATRLSRQTVENPFAARFSIPYNVSSMILHRPCGLEDYEPPIFTDRRIHELATKVTVYEDPELTGLIPDIRAARMEVFLKDGTRHHQFIERARGNFDNPYSDEILWNKFLQLAQMTIPEQRAHRMIDMITGLETLDDIGQCVGLIGQGAQGELA